MSDEGPEPRCQRWVGGSFTCRGRRVAAAGAGREGRPVFPALRGKTDSHERDRPGQGPAPRSGPVPRLRAQPPPGSKGQSRELSSGRRPVSEQRPSGWEAGAQAQGRGTQGASPGSILLRHPIPAPGAVSPIPVTPAPRAVSPEAGYACGGCSGSREPARGAEAKAGAGVPGGRADRAPRPRGARAGAWLAPRHLRDLSLPLFKPEENCTPGPCQQRASPPTTSRAKCSQRQNFA